MKAKERATAAQVEIVHRIWATGSRVVDADNQLVVDVAHQVIAKAILAAQREAEKATIERYAAAVRDSLWPLGEAVKSIRALLSAYEEAPDA